MKKSIVLGEKYIAYEFKRHPRSKHVRFYVTRERGLLVTSPRVVPFATVEGMIRKKSAWIVKTLEYFAGLPARPSGPAREELFETHKNAAADLVSRRLEHWNRRYGFTWRDVRIRDQRTRWGSCSKKGNLNFSYKLALLPPHLADYVIVHEMCHLKEFNHSEQFWSLVARAIPDHAARRKELLQHRLA